MSARVDVSVGVVAPTRSSTAPLTGQVFLAGQTARGPLVPTQVAGEADFTAIFGPRLGGAALFDAVRLLGLEGSPARVTVVRATGPAAAPATISLDTGNLVVTAKGVGAYANGWTAGFTAASKTLTITADGATESYTGATIDTLLAAAAASKTVTVTGTALPSADVSPAALASGTDDFANVVWTDVLGSISEDLGAGAVLTPGVPYTASASALTAHAQQTSRLAIVSVPAAATLAEAKTAAAAVASYDGGDYGIVVWPAVAVGGVTYDGAVFGAAARGRAHAQGGSGRAPYQQDAGQAVSQVVPVSVVSDAEWADLDASGVAVVRTVASRTRLYGWPLAEAMSDTLDEGQFRDLLNDVVHSCEGIGERWVGETFDAKGRALSDFTSELVGYLETMSNAGALYPLLDSDGNQVDPGYVVDTGPAVNSTADLAAGKVAALVKIRVSPVAQFIEIKVGAGDATASL